MKLASCQFPTVLEQVKPLNPSGSELGYGGYVVYWMIDIIQINIESLIAY